MAILGALLCADALSAAAGSWQARTNCAQSQIKSYGRVVWMSHGHTRIASRGACIYCGARGVRLDDEHVVPLSLGGQHILEDASCLSCADITTKFERDVARDMWGDARNSYNVRSRRKRKRKTHIASGCRPSGAGFATSWHPQPVAALSTRTPHAQHRLDSRARPHARLRAQAHAKVPAA
jgi:hypothetical protein